MRFEYDYTLLSLYAQRHQYLLNSKAPANRPFQPIGGSQNTSICWHTISHDLIVPNVVVPFFYTVFSIAFYCINDPIFHLLHDSGVIRMPVLRSGMCMVVPIKKDKHSRQWFLTAVQPSVMVLEPPPLVCAQRHLRSPQKTYIRKMTFRTFKSGGMFLPLRIEHKKPRKWRISGVFR